MRPLKVLIVDDEYWVRENLRSLLVGLGPGVEVLEPANDGEMALARVTQAPPDLVITDIDMPFLDGNELIKALKSAAPRVQVVVLSGYSDFSYVRESLLDGAVDYLLKPVTPEALARLVDQARQALESRLSSEGAEASNLEDAAITGLLGLPGQGPRPAGPVPDLDFEVFRLLLVRVVGNRAPESGRDEDPRTAALRIKALVRRELEGSGKTAVFQNQLARNDFLVLGDQEPERLAPLAHRLSENLGRLLGCEVEVSVSRPFSRLAQVNQAYQECRAALFGRVAGHAPRVVWYEELRHQPVEVRVTGEHEKRLSMALFAGDQSLVRQIVFEDIGLGDRARDWRLSEIQQTAAYVAGFVGQRAPEVPASRLGLLQETFQGQLARAVQNRNLEEVRLLVHGWIAEVMGDEGGKSVGVTMRQTVRRVKEHIEEHYDQNLSLASLAETFRVDPSYLSKAFKQVTGTNLMAAIAGRRIEKAKEYITHRRFSLTEVASLVGYEDYAYFNRVFHKIEGKSPTEFKTLVGRGEG